MAFDKIPILQKKLFLKEFKSNDSLQKYANHFLFQKLLAVGRSSWIFVVEEKHEKQKYTIKLEKEKSTRKSMVEKEAMFLEKLEKYKNLGQTLIDYNIKGRFLVWKYIEALPLNLWLKTAKKTDIKLCIKKVLKTAQLLDSLNIDHGQLSGTGSNIIITTDKTPIIIDFEKASDKRKPHNYNVLINFFKKRNLL